MLMPLIISKLQRTKKFSLGAAAKVIWLHFALAVQKRQALYLGYISASVIAAPVSKLFLLYQNL